MSVPLMEVTPVKPAGIWRRRAALALEIVILIYGVAMALFLAGLTDLGFATLNRGEKPLLILLIAIPLRITLDEPS
jgi:hypothetical protein